MSCEGGEAASAGQRFQTTLKEYLAAMESASATSPKTSGSAQHVSSGILSWRLFAFEPPEDQPDNDHSIIVIPNQGDQHTRFYLATMLNDLAISLLCKFDSLVLNTWHSITIVVL